MIESKNNVLAKLRNYVYTIVVELYIKMDDPTRHSSVYPFNNNVGAIQANKTNKYSIEDDNAQMHKILTEGRQLVEPYMK